MARPISTKYRRRVTAVGRETLVLRSRARGILKRGLQEVTQEQLYDRTPLKVSRSMFNSIKTRFVPGGVEVFYDGGIAPHARKRLQLKGISKSGGHVLDMQPSVGLVSRSSAQLRLESKLAQKRIVEGR